MIKGSGIFTKTLNPLFLISIEALTFFKPTAPAERDTLALNSSVF